MAPASRFLRPAFYAGFLLGSCFAQVVLGGEAQVSIGDAQVTEGNSGSTNLEFTVTRSGDTTSNLVLRYNTEDGLDYPATADVDYVTAPASSLLRIPGGETSENLNVSVFGDSGPEADEQVLLQLTRITAFSTVPDLATAPTFGVGVNPTAVAIVDIDGDGLHDVVSANVEGVSVGTVSALRNTSSGGVLSLAPKQDFDAGAGPSAIAVGDVDGDGKTDLAVANSTAGSVSVLRNTSTVGSISFAPKVDLTTGGSSQSVAIGDLDGDGKSDLATANGSTVSVLRSVSSPGMVAFDPRQDFGVGSGAASVAIGDIDGDGKPDLACANSSSATVSVLRNQSMVGVVSFATKQDVNSGLSPLAVVIDDVDGDNKVDLAVANFNIGSVSIVRNTSTPGSLSFDPRVAFATGAGSRAIAVRDFDSDGKRDLAVANRNSNTLSVLRNVSIAGNVTFEFRRDFGSGPGTHTVAAGDINGDGKPDALIGNGGSGATVVSVLVNRSALGNLDFGARREFDTDTYPYSVAIGDLTADGKSELAVANYGSNSVSVLRNTSAPGILTMDPKQDVAVGTAPQSVAIGDLNSDGKQDLAVANSGSNTVSLLRNTSSNGFLGFDPDQEFSVGANPLSVAIGDVDGDGKPDVAVANFSSNTISVLRNISTTGAINLAAKQDFSVGSGPYSVAIGDIDGDGRAEICAALSSSHVSVLRNNSAVAAINFFGPQLFGVGATPISIAIGDIDGDGKLDVATANNGSANVSVLRNTSVPGPVTFNPSLSFAAGTNPRSLAIGDLDGNGKPDIVVANIVGGTLSVLLNGSVNGTVGFDPKQDFKTGMSPYATALGDLNGDDGPEVVVTNSGPFYTVSVFRGSTNFSAVFTDNEAVGTILNDDDTTPNGFSFTAVNEVPVNSLQSSNTITVSGINLPTAISISGDSGAAYKINSGSFTSSSGTVNNGDTVQVRVNASGSFSTLTSATLNIGGVTGAFDVTTEAQDITPNAFNFTDVSDVARSTLQTSNNISVTGINTAAPISVSGGFYAVNDGPCIQTSGVVNNNDTVKVCHTSSASFSANTDTTLTIGNNGVLVGVSDTFRSTTLAEDLVPDGFTFTDQVDVPLTSLRQSNEITVTGINSSSPISVVGGHYSKNGGGFTAATGSVVEGDTVRVRHTSSAVHNTDTNTTLTIGGVSDTFTSVTEEQDATPDGFAFTDVSDVARNSVQESNVVTISGINSAAAISVTGGEFSINGASYTSVSTTVQNGNNVRVRHTASSEFSTGTDTVLTIGGVSDTFTSTTEAEDTTPNAFSFTDVSDVAVSSVQESNPVTITGINSAASISVTGGQFRINGGAYTSTAATVQNGNTVQVRHTASSGYAAATDTVLTIGTGGGVVSDTFTSTTLSEDTVPDSFSFTDQDDVPLSSLRQSNEITVAGINSSSPISVAGGQYSKNGGGFVASAGTVVEGDTVKVRHTSSAVFDTDTDTTLTIGGVSDTFTSTTEAEDTAALAFAFSDVFGVAPGSVQESNSVTISGINAPTAISVSGGEYSVNGNPFTSITSTVVNGQSVRVRHTASLLFATATDTVLTVGSGGTAVSDQFTSTTEAQDTAPESFTFIDVTGVTPGTSQESNNVLINGINSPAAISISGGEYSVNGGVFISSVGTVQNGQSVRVRHVASASYSTSTDTTLTVGTASDMFTSTTVAEDTSPDAFSFTDVSNVVPGSVQQSNLITITGINAAAAISVTGGEFSINGGTYTSTSTTISSGSNVRVRHVASSSLATATDTMLTVGGASDQFTSTTAAQDTPDPFTFVDQTGVTAKTLVTSNTITVSGIVTPKVISISGAATSGYSIGCTGSFTNAPGSISNGQTVCVRHKASASHSTQTHSTLTIGGVSDTFTSTTAVADSDPDSFSFVDQTGVPPGSVRTSNTVNIVGINTRARISVRGGQYSIGCAGPFRTSPGFVTNGQSVCVRHTASSSPSSTINTTLTIGRVSDTFSSTTQ